MAATDSARHRVQRHAVYPSQHSACLPPRAPGPVSGVTEAAAAWRLDGEDVALSQLGPATAIKLLNLARRALDPLVAGGTGRTTVQAEGRHLAAVGHQCCLHRLEEPNPADSAVTTPVAALAAGAAMDAVAFQQ